MLSLLCKPFKFLFNSNKNTDQNTDLDVNVDVDVLEKEYVIHPYILDNLDNRDIEKLFEIDIEPKSNSIQDKIDQSNSIDKPFLKIDAETCNQDKINQPDAMDNSVVTPPTSPVVLPQPCKIASANTNDRITEQLFIEQLVDEAMKKHGLQHNGLHQNKKQRRKYKGKNKKQQLKKNNKNKNKKKLQQHKTKKLQKVAKKLRVQPKIASHSYNLRSRVKK